MRYKIHFILIWLLCFQLGCGFTKRLALIIGNETYKEARLYNPVNDATDIANALEKVGFNVILEKNLNKEGLIETVRTFVRQISTGDEVVFYFSGHGVQVDKINYLVPVGIDLRSENEVKYNSLAAQFVVDELVDAGSKVSIVILDACRNNPFKGVRSGAAGLAPMEALQGTLIAYSTSPNNVARDGEGRNSPYTKHLKEAIQKPNIKIEDAFKAVRLAVFKETDGSQTPIEDNLLFEDFYFSKVATTDILQINSNPEGADVYIDGRKVGKTPLEEEVTFGTHYLRIVLDDEHESYNQEITVEPSRKVGVNSILAELPLLKESLEAHLAIATVPEDAQVFINNRLVEKDNLTLVADDYTITVKADGYKEKELNISLAKGEIKALPITLTLLPKSKINIISNPVGAEVFIAEKSIGKTPLEKLEYAIGEYDIRLSLAGYEDYKQVVDLQTDKPFTVEANLKQLKGKLHIDSEPQGAEVLIGGKVVGLTPLEGLDYKLGNHKLQLRLENYEDFSQNIEVASAEVTALTAKLIPLVTTGILSISSQPRGAGVFLDDNFIGATPIKDLELQQGDHLLILRLSGYEDEKVKVTVTARETISIEKILSAVKDTGAVKVTSNPTSAGILINGSFVGTTPAILDLPEGNHDIVVNLAGYSSYSKTVNVISGITLEVNIKLESNIESNVESNIESKPKQLPETASSSTLQKPEDVPSSPSKKPSAIPSLPEPKPAPNSLFTLTMLTKPVDAELVIDGQVREKTYLQLEAGTYKLEVRAKGFKSKTYNVMFEAGEDYLLESELESEQTVIESSSENVTIATLTMLTKPDNAELIIDGQVREKTYLQLEAGTYNLEVRAKGFKSKTYAFVFEAGEDYLLEAELESELELEPEPEPEPVEGFTDKAQIAFSSNINRTVVVIASLGNDDILMTRVIPPVGLQIDLPAGEYEIKATAVNAKPFIKNVTLVAGQKIQEKLFLHRFSLEEKLFAGVFNDDGNSRLFLVTNFGDKQFPRQLTVTTPQKKVYAVTLATDNQYILKDIPLMSGRYKFSTEIAKTKVSSFVNINAHSKLNTARTIVVDINNDLKSASARWGYLSVPWYKIDVYYSGEVVKSVGTISNDVQIDHDYFEEESYKFCIVAFNWNVDRGMPGGQANASKICRVAFAPALIRDSPNRNSSSSSSLESSGSGSSGSKPDFSGPDF